MGQGWWTSVIQEGLLNRLEILNGKRLPDFRATLADLEAGMLEELDLYQDAPHELFHAVLGSLGNCASRLKKLNVRLCNKSLDDVGS